MKVLFRTCLLASLLPAAVAAGYFKRLVELEHLQLHARRREGPQINSPKPEKHASSPFLNAKSRKFVVNGTAVPEIDFDIGESYAGLLPISSRANETRKLYFW